MPNSAFMARRFSQSDASSELLAILERARHPEETEEIELDYVPPIVRPIPVRHPGSSTTLHSPRAANGAVRHPSSSTTLHSPAAHGPTFSAEMPFQVVVEQPRAEPPSRPPTRPPSARTASHTSTFTSSRSLRRTPSPERPRSTSPGPPPPRPERPGTSRPTSTVGNGPNGQRRWHLRVPTVSRDPGTMHFHMHYKDHPMYHVPSQMSNKINRFILWTANLRHMPWFNSSKQNPFSPHRQHKPISWLNAEAVHFLQQRRNNFNEAMKILRSNRPFWTRIWMLFQFLLPMNYYRVHLLYILTVAFIASGLLFATYDDLSYIDSAFLTVSAITQTGLITTDFSIMPLGTQVVVFFVCIAGSIILLTTVPLIMRRRYYEKAYGHEPDQLNQIHEYRALGMLLWIVLGYYVAFILIGGFIFTMIYAFDHGARQVQERNNQTSPVWPGIFLSLSAFQNVGISVLPDSLVQFQRDTAILLMVSTLTHVGNTMYPMALRFIVWIFYRLSKGHRRQTLKYLLDHPRRCYTHMFSAVQTWWLLLAMIMIIIIQFAATMIFNWNRGSFADLDPGDRVLNAYFMSVVTRSSGFNSVDVSQYDMAMQFLMIGFMYLSSTPVWLAVRYSDARSSTDDDRDISGANPQAVSVQKNTMRTQARQLLVQDTFYLFLLIFVILAAHQERLDNDLHFTFLRVVYEVISAYGPTGLSMGYPGSYLSFSAQFNVVGKVCVMIVMMLGRHRGLPMSIDKAVQLIPSRKPPTRRHSAPDISRPNTPYVHHPSSSQWSAPAPHAVPAVRLHELLHAIEDEQHFHSPIEESPRRSKSPPHRTKSPPPRLTRTPPPLGSNSGTLHHPAPSRSKLNLFPILLPSGFHESHHDDEVLHATV